MTKPVPEVVPEVAPEANIASELTELFLNKVGDAEEFAKYIASGLNPEITQHLTNILLKQTLQKEAEFQEQEHIERRNRDALINSIHDLMWSIDSDMRLIAANAAYIQTIKIITGKEIQPGQDVLQHLGFADETLNRWTDRYSRVLNGETYTEEDYTELPEPAWAEISFNPIIEGASIVGAACISKNITNRKKAQVQLKQSEKMMADAQRIAHVASWELGLEHEDPTANYVQWSEEAFRIFGYDPKTDKASYDGFLKRVHPEDIDNTREVVGKAIAEITPYSLEHRIVLPDGSVRWVSLEGEVVMDKETGKPQKLVGTNRDITERKIMENEREKMISDLMQRNNDLEQFAYIISHNLRSPVANIMGLTTELKSGPDNEIRLMYLTELSNSVDKLDGVIKDLNYILQIKREITEVKEKVVFSALVRDIRASISNMIHTQKVIIETNFTDAEDMHSIKSYMHSIFYNLITNSIKYHREGVAPHISIKSRSTENGVALIFSDNGMGIDLELQGEKVFGLYKRFHTHVEGKGMGLFMTKTQIEALGGTISIDSQVDAGSQFKIEFKK